LPNEAIDEQNGFNQPAKANGKRAANVFRRKAKMTPLQGNTAATGCYHYEIIINPSAKI